VCKVRILDTNITLIFTLSIVIIEVGLIGAMALRGKFAPTLVRDTMAAVLMIVLNAAVGLCLLCLRKLRQLFRLAAVIAGP
jgi:Ca2+/H+ antiporter